MSFYQNVNEIEDDILKIEPITWGNFQILGLQENFPKDDPVFYSFYRSRNESWHNLIRGILTNDINLVRDNVNKPILYQNEKTRAVFYIISDNIGYIYIMKVSDFESSKKLLIEDEIEVL